MKPLTTGLKIGICLAAAVVVLLLGVALGSVSVSLRDILSVLGFKLFGRPTAASASVIAIVWQLRLPRVLLGFFVGAALAVSGAVMQSVLKNPLASSYTLGVSSGASLGVGVLMILGVSAPALGLFLYPAVALPCGLATVF
ncbi:MAG: iron ABC transporter permease, partial [Oscillospiraceae bacterium]|nr:iron ABC transporter permease [Oscillospiraceae bacterium]